MRKLLAVSPESAPRLVSVSARPHADDARERENRQAAPPGRRVGRRCAQQSLDGGDRRRRRQLPAKGSGCLASRSINECSSFAFDARALSRASSTTTLHAGATIKIPRGWISSRRSRTRWVAWPAPARRTKRREPRPCARSFRVDADAQRLPKPSGDGSGFGGDGVRRACPCTARRRAWPRVAKGLFQGLNRPVRGDALLAR